MIIKVGRREDAKYMAPAAMLWLVLHTKTGRVAGASLLLATVLLGLALGATDASERVVVGAVILLGICIPPVLFPLAVREQKARERR